MKRPFLFVLFLVALSTIFFAPFTFAADSVKFPAVSGEVVRVISSDEISGSVVQVKILEGDEKGREILIQKIPTDVKLHEHFFVGRDMSPDDKTVIYSFVDYDRLPVDYFFIGLFLLCSVVVGGKQGIRGLLTLLMSLLLIFFVLLPGIVHGYSAGLLSALISVFIIVFGSYVTHGFSRATSAAVVGMLVTLLFTGIMAYITVPAAHLSGYFIDGASDLGEFGGEYDFQSLLFGGIIIGLLGVLIDMAIAQAVSVEELLRINPNCDRKIIFERALRIGREHIGTLVNILAILYVGTSLPVLLLYYSFGSQFYAVHPMLNHEMFSTEIIRTMIESIGLILTVPVTTLLAVFILGRKR